MKKSLIALAVGAAVSAPAFAQAPAAPAPTVSLSGNIKTGIAQTKFSSGTAADTNKGSSLALTDGSSRIIFSGSENLGGGLSAVFQVDTRLRPDENTAIGLTSGNTFAGLKGGFGEFRAGRLDLHYFYGLDQHGARATALQASSNSLLSYINGSSIAFATRSDNVLWYNSPALGPVTLTAAYSFNPANAANVSAGEGVPGDGSKGDAFNIAANAAAGAFKGGLSYWDYDDEGTTSNGGQKAYRLYVDAKFGAFTVGVTYDQSKLKDAAAVETKRNAYSVPVTWAIGSGTVLATYTNAGKSSTGGSDNADSGATMISVGYDYALSRRTSLGISYAQIKNQAAASYRFFTGHGGTTAATGGLGNLPAPIAGQDLTQIYAGLRIGF